MPGSFLTADTSMPDLSKAGSTEEKLEMIQNYLYMLLENLRYTLRNLDPSENFNASAVDKWADQLVVKHIDASSIDARTIVTNTFITNEMYAEYGAIADLTVDTLRTDYTKAQRYLNGDTSNIDYLSIHDEEIAYITASTDGTQSEQMHVDGRYFYWRDAEKEQMTSEEVTAWPVMVYKYTELIKAKFAFDLVSGTKIPQMVFGAGTNNQQDSARGRGYIRKNPLSFDVWLLSESGVKNGIFCGNDYTDLVGLRRATSLNFGNWDGGSFMVTLEGKDDPTTYGVTLDSSGRPTKILYPDGKACTITWG